MSLIDMMVALSLTAVLTYLLFLFSSGVGRHYLSISEKMNQLERARAFERVIEGELKRSSPAGISIAPPTPAGQTISAQRFVAAVPPGRLRWSDEVFILRHLSEDKKLIAWQTKFSQMGIESDLSHPEPIPPETLLSLSAMQEEGSYRVWENVSEFTLHRPEGTAAVQVTATFEQIGLRRNRHYYKSDRLYPIWNDFEP